MKRLLSLFVCIACLQGAYANLYFVAEVDTVEVDTVEVDTTDYVPSEPSIIHGLALNPQQPTTDDDITLFSFLTANASYKQKVEISGDTILVSGSYSLLANSPLERKEIQEPLGKLPVGNYMVIQYVDVLGDPNEVVENYTAYLPFKVVEPGIPLDTGEVVIPVPPSKPTISVPVIREGDNVTEYPHNPAVEEMLSSVKPAKQEFAMTIEGKYLRIKGTLWARGYDKHYIHCQIIGDSVHLQRFDMDPESTDMILHNVDILIPGFTDNYYHVTLAEQNDVSLYREYMMKARPVKREVTNIKTPLEQSIQLNVSGSTIFCTSPNAVKLEIYTMDAVKVGESSFTYGEATVKVNKSSATYFYIVTYPNGQRTSGKVVVK